MHLSLSRPFEISIPIQSTTARDNFFGEQVLARVFKITSSFSQLTPELKIQLRQKFGPYLDKLLALQDQYDVRLCVKEAFNIGCELADRGMVEGAVAVFSALVGTIHELSLQGSAFQDINAKAQERLSALHGTGHILPRIEYLAKQMPKEIFNLSGFSAMAAAMPTFRFTTAAAKAVLGTGIGPWLAANTIGFLAESAMFTSVGRGVREFIDGRGAACRAPSPMSSTEVGAAASFAEVATKAESSAPTSWGTEWVHGMPMLFGLKTFGGLAGLAGQALLERGYGYTALQSFSLWSIHQVAMLNGIMFGNHVSNSAQGISRDFWMQLAEAGVTAVHFNAVGSMLGVVANPHEALRRDLSKFIRRLSVSSFPRFVEIGPQLVADGARQAAVHNPQLESPQSKGSNTILANSIEGNGRGALDIRLSDLLEKNSRSTLEIGLQEFINLNPHGVAVFEMKKGEGLGNVIMANPNLATLFGYLSTEVIGKPIAQFFEWADALRFADGVTESQNGRFFDLREVHLKRQDGSPILCDVHGGVGEFNGREIGFAFIEDVSARKQAEEYRLSREKLKVLELVGRSLAHDANNALTVVVSYSDLIKDSLHRVLALAQSIKPRSDRTNELSQDGLLSIFGEALEDIKVLDEQAQVIKRLIGEFRELTAEAQRGPPFDIHTLLREDKVRPIFLGRDIELEIKLASEPWHVPILPAKMERAIHNLVSNARDAMEGRKIQRLFIETSRVELGQEELAALLKDIPPAPDLAVKPGRFMRMRVQDTGSGIDEKIRHSIFTPYFSTKPKGRESDHGGIGLAITRKFVQDVGGFITVESTLEQGTSFDVYLPHVAENDSEAITVPAPPPTSSK